MMVQVSNVDLAIMELMATRQFPPSYVDMYGDIYRPGSGSKKSAVGGNGCPYNEYHNDFQADSGQFYALLDRQQQTNKV